MKKVYYLLLFVLLASISAKAQTGWVSTKLDEKVSVKFPAEPQKTSKTGIDVYVFRGADSVAYSASRIDYQVVANLDSATLAPMKDMQRFADQLKAGIASKKTNYTFGDITIGNWKTYTTYSMKGVDNTTKSTLYTYMLLMGSKMYSLSCRIPVGMVSKSNEVYFASVEVK